MGSLCWTNAHLTICLVLALLVGTAAEANESARPEVRVAFMWAGLSDAFTTIEFMAQQIRRNVHWSLEKIKKSSVVMAPREPQSR